MSELIARAKILQTASPEAVRSALYKLDAGSIVSTYRGLVHVDEEKRSQGEPQDNDLEFHKMQKTVEVAIGEDPDPARLKAVGTTLAKSRTFSDLAMACVLAPRITRVDREFGVTYWDRLMRHYEGSVRSIANDMLEPFDVATTDRGRQTACDSLNLTLLDAQNLHGAYLLAEEGVNLYDPDADAVRRLGELLLQEHP